MAANKGAQLLETLTNNCTIMKFTALATFPAKKCTLHYTGGSKGLTH